MRGWAQTAGIVAVATTVVAAGGCSAKSEERVPAKTWARSICSAVAPWSAEVQGLQAQARRRISTKSNPEQSKTELVRLFGVMELATDSAVRRVKGAGVPNVRDGDRIASEFVRALVVARDSFGMGMSAVQRLPTVDQNAFHDGVVAAGQAMSRQNGTATKALTKVSSPELDKAFDAIAECRRT